MERVRVLSCDHLNLARGKYITVDSVGKCSTRLCQGLYALTYNRDLLPAPGSRMLEGLPDIDIVWDSSELRKSWVPDESILVADFREVDGTPLPVCGRSLLKRSVSEWHDNHGLTPKVGIELESYAFVYNDDGVLVPLESLGSYVYATGPHADSLGFTDAIWECALKCGFPLDVITTEFDESQFEFVLKYDDAVKAIDDIFLFKLMAREVALEFGVILTFMPQPIKDRGGCGVHINFSLFDKSGTNCIMINSDSGGPSSLSEIGKGCISGLLEHHKSLSGILAPTVNSYSRLQPASMSGYWSNWGGDHRSVTVRVSSEVGMKSRIEHRMADSGSNPYTATAAVLQAAKLGVENGYSLPSPEEGDGFEDVNTKVHVADNLSDALDDLSSDKVLVSSLGDLLVENHIFIKRAEISEVESCKDDISKRDYYIHYI